MAFLDETGLAELWSLVKAEDVNLELLWENASPTSSFAAQSVEVDWAGNDNLLIETYSPSFADYEGNTTTPATHKMHFLFSVNGVGKSFNLEETKGVAYYHTGAYDNRGRGYSFSRTVTLADGSLAFSTCMGFIIKQARSDSSCTPKSHFDDTFIVPVKIYRVRGLHV